MDDTYSYLASFWYVLLSVSAWSVFYFVVLKTNKSRSLIWNCRLVALAHSLTAVGIVNLAIILDDNPFKHLGEKNTRFQNAALIASAGYFIFDLIWCIVMGTEGILMLMHHVISILSLIGGLYLNHSGAEIAVTLWGSELTNPFLQIRWFLKELKQYNTRCGMINDFIFVGIFGFSRVCIGSGLAYLFYFADKTILVIKMFGFLFYGISLIWMWQIMKFINYKYFSKAKERSATVSD